MGSLIVEFGVVKDSWLVLLQVGVLVVDCQGTGDTANTDTQLDTLIFYIGLQISSFQIINVLNRLKSDDITRLDVSYIHVYSACLLW